MIVGKAIYYLLTNATDVTDVVSTRIYPEVAQQDSDLPFIVYNVTNNEPTDTKPEPSKLDTAQVEVNIYAESYTEAIDLAVAVRAALDRVKGTYSGVNVQSIQYLNEIIDFDEPQRAYNISADYDVRISRTDFEIAQGSPISGTNLGELNDVDVTGVTNGQLIAYNSTTGNWEAADDASGGAVDSVNGQTGVVVIDMDDIDDVDAATPFGGDVLQWTGTAWEPSGKLNLLYSLLKEGTDTSIKNGGGTDSELKLESTKATVSTGITKVVLTETSPGDIEFVVATDADGDTAFTALHLDGSSTANRADLLVKFGTYFKFEDGNFTQWIRPSSGATQDTTIILPSTSGVLGRADDIPTSVTNLTDVTSAGSGAIITDAERTNLTTNTAKVGLIAGGTTGQALVKSTGTDYDVEWADIAVDVQYHQRYDTEAAALRSGATETVELYYTAQADGDGLSESASSDTPTSGYDIRRKLYYAEKAQADPDTSADWTQFTAIADNTTFANAKAALLAYLKERTGGTVPISLKMTWEEVAQAPAFTGLLNESYGSGAEAAYSTRRLNGNVTECMVIRRASDSETETIGFDSEGNIDESAIETFCTGTTCTVVTWKDQSGNGNDATAPSGKEPIIYTGGALIKEGGKTALDFASTDPTVLNLDTEILSAKTIFSTASIHTLSAINYLLFSSTTAGGNIYYGGTATGGGIGFYRSGYRDLGIELLGQQLGYFRLNSTNNNYDVASNGGTVTNLGSGYGVMRVESLARDFSDFQTGRYQEVIIYDADKSSVRTSIESNIGDYFTQNTPLLDTYSGAAAAYSLRLLDSTYTGALINVWNGTSYADIYPNVFGELDTVALAAHCGSNDGFIRYWYDQSSNGNTAAQTTTGSMPKIYDGTTGVVTENGKPAVEFDGSNDILINTTLQNSFEGAAQAFTMLHVAQTDDTSNFQYSFSLLDGANATLPQNDQFGLILANDNKSGAFIRDYSTSTTSLPKSSAAVGTSQHLNTAVNTGSTLSVYASGTAGDSVSVNYPALAFDYASVGGRYGGTTPSSDTLWSGKIQEIIAYASNKSSDRTGIEDNINTFYNIY